MVKRTEAGLAEARVYLGFTKIVSPVDGVVTAKFIDPGTMAMPGIRLLTIEDTSGYRLEAEIDESLAGQITPGLNVEVEINALQMKLQGKISEAVRSGLFARIRIPVGQQELILLPVETLVSKGQLTGVYTVDSKKIITYRLVRTGRQFDGKVEILSGLKPGDTIISDNVSEIVDGSILQTEN